MNGASVPCMQRRPASDWCHGPKDCFGVESGAEAIITDYSPTNQKIMSLETLARSIHDPHTQNVSPIEYEESIKKVLALDWDRMLPGHPYAGGRLGTKKDAQDQFEYLQDLSVEVKKVASTKCIDTAMKESKLPKYEKWANYEQYLPGNIERYCYWWTQSY
jgi:hypothetical protein